MLQGKKYEEKSCGNRSQTLAGAPDKP
jgi:hypothetical protein